MKIIQKIGIVAVMIFFMGGIIYNSFFVSQKQDESYASLKEKYNISNTTTKGDTEEPVITEAKEPELKVDVKKDNTASESKKENRTRENIVWDYLKSAGYTDIQTAAIIGNLYQESGLNPERVEYKTKEGIGLVQWSFGRKQKLIDYASSKGVEWTDLNAQLEFLVKELKSSEFYQPYKSTFQNPYSINEATEAYCWGFERPNAKYANLQYRKDMAWAAYYRNVDR